jgi:hypothetical protein
LDGLGALRYLKKTYGVEEAYIFGRSLGGAVAIATAEAAQEATDGSIYVRSLYVSMMLLGANLKCRKGVIGVVM